jgi:Protein of unknown function DUF262/Protein of unknown function (DUF1524)
MRTGNLLDVKCPTVGEVFKESFYEVPVFQREYVWKAEQVEALLCDTYEALFDERGSPIDAEYFIGSIVVYRGDNGIFQLIDGQQRITTLYLTLCAIRDSRKEWQDPESLRPLERMIQDENDRPDGTTYETLRLKPLYDDADSMLESIANGQAKAPLATQPNSAKNMYAAYEQAREFLSQFKADVSQLRLFQAALTQRVRMVRILTPGINDALRIFETINDRGLGLDALDLLKNLLFMQVGVADSAEAKKLTRLWREMVKTITDTGRGEKPLRFLRYFVLANYPHARESTNKPLVEDSLFKWLSEHKEELGIVDEPLQFVGRLLASAKAYQRFIDSPDFYLSNIYSLSGRARQHLIILLACDDLKEAELEVVTKQLERILVAYQLTQESPKNLDVLFSNFAPKLKEWILLHRMQAGFLTGLNQLLSEMVGKEIDRLGSRIEDALDRLGLAKRTICRFVMCRLAQHLQKLAGISLAQTKIDDFKAFEIEHVLPNNPTSEQKENFDLPQNYDVYKQRLGNLTLLEKPLNASIGRNSFSQKQIVYEKSTLFMTKSLSQSQSVGGNTAFARTAKLLSQHQVWNSKAVDARQEDLKQLANQLWTLLLQEAS